MASIISVANGIAQQIGQRLLGSCPESISTGWTALGRLASTKGQRAVILLESVSCTATRLATTYTTLTLSGLNCFHSQVFRKVEHGVYQAKNVYSQAQCFPSALHLQVDAILVRLQQ